MQINKILFLLLIWLSNKEMVGQDIVEHFKQVVSIDSISSNINLSDIANSNRIIFMGELSHSDSLSDVLSLELIKDLHTKYGYNVLVNEIDMYPMYISYNDTIGDISKSLALNYWSKLRPAENAIVEYVQSQVKTENPLILRGNDLFNAPQNIGRLKQVIEKTIENPEIILESYEIKFFEKYYYKNNRRTPKLINAKAKFQYKHFTACCNFIIAKLKCSNSKDTSLKKFLIQTIENIQGTMKWSVFRKRAIGENYINYSLRDEQMARNLLWIIYNEFPNQKIIVRMSNYHLTRNSNKIKRNHYLQKNRKKCLDIIKNSIKENYFSIAFTHFNTPFGIKNSQVEYRKRSNKKSIESILHGKGFNYAFINLKRMKEKGINTKFISYIFLDKPSIADWAEVYDAIIFIDKEKYNPKCY